MDRRNAGDRNAGSARPSRTEQALCLLQPVGFDIGFQQRELDEVVLRAAAANAFAFSGEWRERVDCRGP